MNPDKHSPDATQAAFRALADPTRRDILIQLAHQDLTIGQVVERYGVTRRAVKKHLIVLEEGGLISVEKHGRERINRLQRIALRRANDWLEQFSEFWSDRLSTLKGLVEEEEKSNAKK